MSWILLMLSVPAVLLALIPVYVLVRSQVRYFRASHTAGFRYAGYCRQRGQSLESLELEFPKWWQPFDRGVRAYIQEARRGMPPARNPGLPRRDAR